MAKVVLQAKPFEHFPVVDFIVVACCSLWVWVGGNAASLK